MKKLENNKYKGMITWFVVIIGLNLIIMIFLSMSYPKIKFRRGESGPKGIYGRRGDSGENDGCPIGSLCSKQPDTFKRKREEPPPIRPMILKEVEPEIINEPYAISNIYHDLCLCYDINSGLKMKPFCADDNCAWGMDSQGRIINYGTGYCMYYGNRQIKMVSPNQSEYNGSNAFWTFDDVNKMIVHKATNKCLSCNYKTQELKIGPWCTNNKPNDDCKWEKKNVQFGVSEIKRVKETTFSYIPSTVYHIKISSDRTPRLGYPKGGKDSVKEVFRSTSEKWGKVILPKDPNLNNWPWKRVNSFKTINNHREWPDMYGWKKERPNWEKPPQEALASMKKDRRATALMLYDSAATGAERWFKTNIPRQFLLKNIMYDQKKYKRQKVVFKDELYFDNTLIGPMKYDGRKVTIAHYNIRRFKSGTRSNCEKACINNPKCKGFDYHTGGKICALNKVHCKDAGRRCETESRNTKWEGYEKLVSKFHYKKY